MNGVPTTKSKSVEYAGPCYGMFHAALFAQTLHVFAVAKPGQFLIADGF